MVRHRAQEGRDGWYFPPDLELMGGFIIIEFQSSADTGQLSEIHEAPPPRLSPVVWIIVQKDLMQERQTVVLLLLILHEQLVLLQPEVPREIGTQRWMLFRLGQRTDETIPGRTVRC